MPKPSLMVDLTAEMTRLLLVVDGVERLRATLPVSNALHIEGLTHLVDGVAEVLSEELSVVLCAEAWGASAVPLWSTSCDSAEGCSVGHLDCEWSETEFARMRERLDEVLES